MKALESLLPDLDLALERASEYTNSALYIHLRLIRREQVRIRALRRNGQAHGEKYRASNDHTFHIFSQFSYGCFEFVQQRGLERRQVNSKQVRGYRRDMNIL